MVDAVADAEHLEAVRHLSPTAGVEVRRLVGEREVREAGLQVPELDGNVLRLDARPGHVNDVEMLRQADEIPEVGEVARALAAVEVADGGRARDRHRCDVAAADDGGALLGAAEDLERLGSGRDRLLDQPAVEAHEQRLLVDGRARFAEMRARLRKEDADPLLLEDRQRGLVQVRDLVRAQDLERRERVLQVAVPDRAPLGRRRRHGRPTAATSSPLSRRLCHHAARSRNGSPSASGSTSMPRPGPAGGGCAPSARVGSPLPWSTLTHMWKSHVCTR